MPILCQLADPEHYVAFDWDIVHDPPSRAYWLGLFSSFSDNIRRHLIEDDLGGDDFEERWQGFMRDYHEGIGRRREDPAGYQLTTPRLGDFRQAMMNRYGFADPFQRIKRRENELAIGLYPQVISKIDRLPPEARWEPLVRSLFAGNMFDLGSPKTIEMYRNGGITYEAMLERVPRRPWHIDHLDALAGRLNRRAYRQVLVFADNAGLDVLLGVIPVVRELARQGMRVVLAANSAPALNDITIDELNPLLGQLAAVDPLLGDLLAGGMIRTVASGCGIPLIDFTQVSEACNAAAAESELIVIEGMGRGVESNWRQTFQCDVWRVAVVKDECVARWLGANVFAGVCRFDAGASALRPSDPRPGRPGVPG